MRRILTISFLVIVILVGCNRASYITVKHVKPVNHNRYYNKKKDKRKKRTKYVKVKILKQSKAVKPPREKPPKKKKDKKDKEQETEKSIPDETQNEADSTGLLY
ncbi:hypothetical protein GCM10009122_37230 [Fulvivirga kasyanovii]|uniref:Lipoprotein n=1 Tax=Fulvivirga kasyanovii TaxID=396812 RepID=A0ABW9RRK4_9BACT|nr:hypothetical protein [Fulvivirga kasyanovii]MTI25605.1 hypothetical protein [Fulvivirga kasyanovii]